jgi:hypothetical protein
MDRGIPVNELIAESKQFIMPFDKAKANQCTTKSHLSIVRSKHYLAETTENQEGIKSVKRTHGRTPQALVY